MALRIPVAVVLICWTVVLTDGGPTRPQRIERQGNLPKTRVIIKYKTGQLSAEQELKAVRKGHLVRSSRAAGSRVPTASASGKAAVSAQQAPAATPEKTHVVLAQSEEAAADIVGYYKTQAKSQIEYVEVDYPLYPDALPTECGSNTTATTCPGEYMPYNGVDKYWGHRAIKVDTVWHKLGQFGGGTKLGAVIDTGVDYRHPELSGVVNTALSTTCMNGGGPCSGDGMDDRGHGTHVAGIMAAKHNGGGDALGISSTANIMSCKYLGLNGGYISDAASCIYNMLAKNATVISNSWSGTDRSQLLQDAVAAACAQDVLFVVSAGNSNLNVNTGSGGRGVWPANFAESDPLLSCVLTVAATDSHEPDRLAFFSNWGQNVMIAAPGIDIYSTEWYGPPDNITYSIRAGTSMATPFVSGVALALRNQYPSLTAQQTKQIIINSGSVSPKGTYNNPGAFIGGKILDAEAANSAAAAQHQANLIPKPPIPSPTVPPKLSPSPSPSPPKSPPASGPLSSGSSLHATGSVTIDTVSPGTFTCTLSLKVGASEALAADPKLAGFSGVRVTYTWTFIGSAGTTTTAEVTKQANAAGQLVAVSPLLEASQYKSCAVVITKLRKTGFKQGTRLPVTYRAALPAQAVPMEARGTLALVTSGNNRVCKYTLNVLAAAGNPNLADVEVAYSWVKTVTSATRMMAGKTDASGQLTISQPHTVGVAAGQASSCKITITSIAKAGYVLETPLPISARRTWTV